MTVLGLHDATCLSEVYRAVLKSFTLAAAVFLPASRPTSLLARRPEARLAH
ncbi:hypothetical protein HHL19_16110 [Streptomyces sp. R302]|uniref:hypothetical protein n=1 Tax=unclassified Streptomyces TaxID=2593676 RepID=UPI00145E6322|nr:MULTISPECIES: hypothetical protein [unclassified Streptomyces]NML51591.1 hypothetical protein [Streptomyces sp. R301]NML80169.1 hypothetical protein [Streptomyces sp. R302]